MNQQHTLNCWRGLQALQQLFCARRILGNSYVSAFSFLCNDMFADEITPEQNDINKSLFEDQQACLETEVGQGMLPNASVSTCLQLIQCFTHTQDRCQQVGVRELDVDARRNPRRNEQNKSLPRLIHA